MTTEQTPPPMTSADCDLRDFAFMPLDITVARAGSEQHGCCVPDPHGRPEGAAS